MSDSKLTSRVPYLFRAMHEWIVDNNQTPFVVVDTSTKGVDVPVGHIKDDRIVLNIGYSAVENLNISNTALSFSARFGGLSRQVYLPIESVREICASESGERMIFASPLLRINDDQEPSPPDDPKPTLRVVK